MYADLYQRVSVCVSVCVFVCLSVFAAAAFSAQIHVVKALQLRVLGHNLRIPYGSTLDLGLTSDAHFSCSQVIDQSKVQKYQLFQPPSGPWSD